MEDDQSSVSGWMPTGKVAGTRDVATGRLDTAPRSADMALVLRQLLGTVVAAAVVATLYLGQDVLIPITLAFILSFILSPIVHVLQRLRLGRIPSVLLTVLMALGFIGSIGMLIGTQTAALSEDAPKYARTLETKLQTFQGSAITRLNTVAKSLGLNRVPSRQPSATSLFPAPSGSARRPVLVEVAPPATTPWGILTTLLQPVVGPLETTLIVIVVAIFILAQKEDLRDRFIRVFGSGDLHRTTIALDDAGKRLSRYFLSQLGINTTFGLIVTAGLWCLGIPSPALWGVLAALLRFVPYIGPVLAAAAPVALAAAVEPGWSSAIIVGGFFIVVETLLGYVVEPLIYGHSTGLSPTSVVVSAIFWTWLWGPVGLILSTPLTLCLVVLGRHVKALEYFDVMLGDRPALTPVERFYQRLLADNADEALAQVELALAECSLAEIYDAIVMPALRLAARDLTNGLVGAQQSTQIGATVAIVIEECTLLATPRGGTPGPEEDSKIICVAGNGPFDDQVARMLWQTMQLQGLRPQLVAHSATARGKIAALDVAAAETIALCYLEPATALAQARYLVRRLRERAELATFISGFWAADAERPSAIERDQGFGADMVAQSLHEVCTSLLESKAHGAKPTLHV